MPRHLLTGEELSAEKLHRLLDRALELKAEPTASRVLEDRTVALLFEHPSTPRGRLWRRASSRWAATRWCLHEAFGELENKVLAYVGDGNNVARSLAILGALAGLEVRIAAPPEFQLPTPTARRA